MEAEDIIFKRIQRAPADQTKIRQVLLALAAIRHAIVFAVTEFQVDTAQVLFLSCQIAEAPIAGSKNGPKDAIAGYFAIIAAGAQSVTMAMRARGFCKRNCL